VSSSESRALLRIDERGISKSVLIKLEETDIKKIVDIAGITMNSFSKNYVIARQRKSYICIFHVKYGHTLHALPSEGGRLRELKPDTNWLTVSEEQILPKPSVISRPPIPYKMVYSL